MSCKVHYIKKKKSVKKILFIIGLFVAAIVIGVAVFIEVSINPIILSFCKEQISKITNAAMNEASLQVLSENALSSNDLVNITYDKDGNISLIQADANNISVTSNRLALKAKEKIEEIGETGIDIPYGSLSGITFLTGLGPNFNVKVYSVSTVRTAIKSYFEEKGINQTLHKIILTIETTVTIAVPGMRSNIVESNSVLMNECIIIGKVPDTFLYSTDIDDMLNLLG